MLIATPGWRSTSTTGASVLGRIEREERRSERSRLSEDMLVNWTMFQTRFSSARKPKQYRARVAGAVARLSPRTRTIADVTPLLSLTSLSRYQKLGARAAVLLSREKIVAARASGSESAGNSLSLSLGPKLADSFLPENCSGNAKTGLGKPRTEFWVETWAVPDRRRQGLTNRRRFAVNEKKEIQSTILCSMVSNLIVTSPLSRVIGVDLVTCKMHDRAQQSLVIKYHS